MHTQLPRPPWLVAGLPNYGAVDLSLGSGLLLAVFVIAVLSFFVAQGDRWRRMWCIAEDPRSVGLFRIAFGICCLCSVNELWPLFEYLFTDEGMWTTDVAQQIRAREQFAGYGDGIGSGELWGFYDKWAVVEWLKGPNYSPLLFDSSPGFFWTYVWAFQISMAMLICGFQTRWVKWVAWFLFHGLISRNTVYWEGTEHVYRCFFFYLALSRCQNAYSVDNWLRCRRLRAQKRLSEPGLPGQGAGAPPSEDHPQGLEAIYQRIPTWPRLLMILQIAAVYLETGAVKNGAVWLKGDAFYYALNLDHFYRLPPQSLSALLGTTMFRMNSWIVHVWECAFPLVVLGMVMRWGQREKLPELAPRRQRIMQISALVAVVAMGALVAYVMPAHTKPPKIFGYQLSTLHLQLLVAAAIGSGVMGLISTWDSMETSPAKIKLFGHEFILNRDWALRWLLGRRVWVAIGFIFHIHLVILMNIGWFNLGIAAAFIIYLNGEEIAAILHRLTTWLRSKRVPLPDPGPSPLPVQDPSLAHLKRSDNSLPQFAAWSALAMAVLGAIMQIWTEPDFFGDLGDLYRNFATMELGDAFAHQYTVVYFNWYAISIVLGLGTMALRIQRGFAPSPRGAIWWLVGGVVFGVAHAHDWLHIRWLCAFSVAVWLRFSSDKHDEIVTHAPPPHSPWAYGPLGRTLLTLMCSYHIVGVAAWLMPDKKCFETFRVPARNQFKRWLGLTQTSQSWKMFAPNPPRSNMFLKTVVTVDGKPVDLLDDVYACFDNPEVSSICDATYPIPWITYTRQRKINRRIAGGTKERDGWWQKWHARWICKAWAYEHNGELPDKIELIKVWYPIPSPEHVWNNGPYDPATQYKKKNKQKLVYTGYCKTEATGQPTNEVRRRRGLPEVPEKQVRPWYKNRCRGWENRRKKEAKERGETVDPEDPYFKICDSEKHKQILDAKRAERGQL